MGDTQNQCTMCIIFFVILLALGGFLATFYTIKDGIYDECMEDRTDASPNNTIAFPTFLSCASNTFLECSENATESVQACINTTQVLCNMHTLQEIIAANAVCDQHLVQTGTALGALTLGTHQTAHPNCLDSLEELLAQKRYQVIFDRAYFSFAEQVENCLQSSDAQTDRDAFSICMFDAEEDNPDHDFFCSKFAPSLAGCYASTVTISTLLFFALLGLCVILYQAQDSKITGLLVFAIIILILVSVALPIAIYAYRYYLVWEDEYDDCYQDSDLGYVFCTRISDSKATVDASWVSLLAVIVFVIMWWFGLGGHRSTDAGYILVCILIIGVMACLTVPPYFHYWEKFYRDCREDGREDNYCTDDAGSKAGWITLGFAILSIVLDLIIVVVFAKFSVGKGGFKIIQ